MVKFLLVGAILVIAQWRERRWQGEYEIRPYTSIRKHILQRRV